jgi:hypothetical protein
MMISLTDEIHRLGQSLLEECCGDADISSRLLETLGPLLAPTFGVGLLSVVGPSGEILIERELLVYSKSAEDADNVMKSLTIERVAGVIYATQLLGPKTLGEGYHRVGAVKSLPRASKPKGFPGHNTPFGAIIACEADRPLEEVVDLMAGINAKIPSTQWSDVISVLSRGVINYAVQFEGSDISGDFLLPNQSGFFTLCNVCARHGQIPFDLYIQ